MTLLLRFVLAFAIASVGAWSAMALYFGPLDTAGLAIAMAAVAVLAAVSVFVARLRRIAIPLFVIALGGFAVWWASVRPTNERHWQPDVAVLPYATFEGDRVTIHNIRNFEYRTETDFTPRYYDKTFDMNALDTADLIASYWMGDAIAHGHG